jgi:ribonuclease VapC
LVLDTSALVAMLLGEPEADQFIAVLAGAEDPLISAGTLLEASIVLQSKLGDAGLRDLDELLATAGVRCVAVDLAQARVARDAFARFGKGRDSAGLNYGDCFAYALAKVTQTPLLFKGSDFSRTDVAAAVQITRRSN